MVRREHGYVTEERIEALEEKVDGILARQRRESRRSRRVAQQLRRQRLGMGAPSEGGGLHPLYFLLAISVTLISGLAGENVALAVGVTLAFTLLAVGFDRKRRRRKESRQVGTTRRASEDPSTNP